MRVHIEVAGHDVLVRCVDCLRGSGDNYRTGLGDPNDLAVVDTAMPGVSAPSRLTTTTRLMTVPVVTVKSCAQAAPLTKTAIAATIRL
jgi:hypothetical protein